MRIGACQTVMYIAIERIVVNKDNSLVMRYRTTGLRQLPQSPCVAQLPPVGRRMGTHCVGTVRGQKVETLTVLKHCCAGAHCAARPQCYVLRVALVWSAW